MAHYVDPYEQRLKQDMKKSDKQRKAEVSKLKSDISKSVKTSPIKKTPVPAMRKKVEKPMGLKSRRGLEDVLGKKGLGGL